MASKRLLLVSYTAAFKLQVMNFAENSGNRSAERELGVSEKLVRDWRKQKTELASFTPENMVDISSEQVSEVTLL